MLCVLPELPAEFQEKFKVSVLTYGALPHLVPGYLRNQCSLRVTCRELCSTEVLGRI